MKEITPENKIKELYATISGEGFFMGGNHFEYDRYFCSEIEDTITVGQYSKIGLIGWMVILYWDNTFSYTNISEEDFINVDLSKFGYYK